MEPLLVSAGLIFILVSASFLLSLVLRSNSIIDIFYGFIFIAVALVTYGLYGNTSIVQSLITLTVIVWGVRLSMRIYFRNKGIREDGRYALWREEWTKKGDTYFIVRSYLQVFVLQGFVIWIVSLPIVLVNIDLFTEWNVFVSIGLAVWIIGFLFESVADWQLSRFLKKPENSRHILKHGLFAFSRRPNYFGESLVWWGMALVAFSNPLNWIAFVSPALITYIMVAVTGPITESIWGGNEEYAEYKRRVNSFVPWFPKKQ